MDTYTDNGRRSSVTHDWDRTLHQPYDYERNGLLNRVMSARIYQTKNPVLRYMLDTVEHSMVYCMRVIDILNNFFNYNYKNY